MRIVATRTLSTQEQNRIASLVKNETASFYVTEGSEIKGIPYEPLAVLSEQSKKEINKQCMDSLGYYADILIANKFNLKLFHYQKFKLYFDLCNGMYEISRIKKLNLRAGDLVFANRSEVKIAFPDLDVVLPNQSSSNWKAVFWFLYLSILRLCLSFVRSRISFDETIFLVDNRETYQNSLTKNAKGYRRQNLQLEYLYDSLDKVECIFLDKMNFQKNGESGGYHPIGKFLRNFNQSKRVYEERILFGYLLKRGHKSTAQSVKQEYEKITELSFESFYESLLHSLFQRTEKSNVFFTVKENVYTGFFKKSGFKKVVIADEYSPNNRVIFNAARSSGLQIIAFQHGSIHKLHPGYSYSNMEALQEVTLPDTLCLWGDGWKKELIEMNWPAERLISLGHLRTDVIPNIKKRHKSVQEILGDSIVNQKILVFASQPLKDAELRELIARYIFKAVKDFDDICLVIKTHPRETDYMVYEQWAKEEGCQNILISPNLELYELLSVTDYLITSFSTVGTEAVYFSIPLIVMDPLRQDVMGFIKTNVGFQTTNAVDLKQTLRKLLEGQLKPDKSHIEEYIRENAFLIDGNTSKRYADFINHA